MPFVSIWGVDGFVNRSYNVLDVWQKYAEKIKGKALDSGHFLPEEAPIEVYDELLRFFGDK